MQVVRFQFSSRIIADDQLASYQIYGEKNYEYINSTIEKIRAAKDSCQDQKKRLRRPYDAKVGVFPCRSFNLGEQSTSFPHTDDGNLAQSWCSISPLGNFDPKNGGHLVLWDFGLVIDFPPGSTVLLPSALIKHSNTPIQAGEKRYSIIQYAAGGLFRWVEHGFMSENDWEAKVSNEERGAYELKEKSRWNAAAEMYTKIDQLKIR